MINQRVRASDVTRMSNLLESMEVKTVCQEALCPNIGECFAKKVATFMILGNICTRNCGFCAVKSGKTKKVDENEPKKISEAIDRLKLDYAVITSVTRDDLKDGGASHFVEVVKAIKAKNPSVKIELLIPDFRGDMKALKKVVKCEPYVLNHNIETIRKLYPIIRSGADYDLSLKILEKAKEFDNSLITKSGLMMGLGETEKEIFETIRDLRDVGCGILTVGQYIPPTKSSFSLKKQYPKKFFEEIKRKAQKLGFRMVFSAPLVRSSYHASDIITFINKSPK